MFIASATNMDTGLEARVVKLANHYKVSLVDLDIERWHGTEYATVGHKSFSLKDEDKALRTAEKWATAQLN